MRLAVFTPQLGSPSETFIRRHLEDLAPGHTVAVVHAVTGEGAWQPSLPVLHLEKWRAGRAVRLQELVGRSPARMQERVIAKFLGDHGVDIALGEYLDRFVEFVPLLDPIGIPYVAQAHGIDVSAALRRPGIAARYRAYESARAILTRSEFHRRRLIGLGLPAEKIHVNPGGVDIPASAPARSPAASKRFLAVGRLVPKKGPLYLLDAFRAAAGEDADVELDVVGDGPLLPAARAVVRAAGLEARVRFHGAAPDERKQRLFEECGVFVQHSLTDPDTGDEEGLPASIQEAMAAAMTVISTRHSGIPEAIEEGVTGLLVDEGDAPAMAGCMLRVASGEYGSALGDAARARASELYSWPAERARLLRYLAAG